MTPGRGGRRVGAKEATPMPDPDHPSPTDPAATPAETAAEEASPGVLTDEERAALAEEAARQEDA